MGAAEAWQGIGPNVGIRQIERIARRDEVWLSVIGIATPHRCGRNRSNRTVPAMFAALSVRYVRILGLTVGIARHGVTR